VSFARIPTEQQAVQLLQRSLEKGRLSHAYLFSGTDLGELELVARTLAKTLNCRNMPVPADGRVATDCCDHCLSCRKIDEDNHPDVQWIRPESKSRVITIDQMRNLMQTVNLKPTEAEWKVAVIVAAERLNVQAANAFLKTLEEPPLRSVILLLSTDPGKILETMLSRCLRLSFGGETRPRLEPGYEDWLSEFSKQAAQPGEGLLARYRLLGSLLAKLNSIKAETDKALTARSPLERYEDVEPRLRERWEDELAAAIEAEYRRRRSDLLLVLQWWLRDVWLQTMALGQSLSSFPSLAAAAEAVAGRISAKEAANNIEVVEQTQRLLGSNVQEALALEVGLLKLKL
jgi:DNA polymerase-3 subunit delta'